MISQVARPIRASPSHHHDNIKHEARRHSPSKRRRHRPTKPQRERHPRLRRPRGSAVYPGGGRSSPGAPGEELEPQEGPRARGRPSRSRRTLRRRCTRRRRRWRSSRGASSGRDWRRPPRRAAAVVEPREAQSHQPARAEPEETTTMETRARQAPSRSRPRDGGAPAIVGRDGGAMQRRREIQGLDMTKSSRGGGVKVPAEVTVDTSRGKSRSRGGGRGCRSGRARTGLESGAVQAQATSRRVPARRPARRGSTRGTTVNLHRTKTATTRTRATSDRGGAGRSWDASGNEIPSEASRGVESGRRMSHTPSKKQRCDDRSSGDRSRRTRETQPESLLLDEIFNRLNSRRNSDEDREEQEVEVVEEEEAVIVEEARRSQWSFARRGPTKEARRGRRPERGARSSIRRRRCSCKE